MSGWLTLLKWLPWGSNPAPADAGGPEWAAVSCPFDWSAEERHGLQWAAEDCCGFEWKATEKPHWAADPQVAFQWRGDNENFEWSAEPQNTR